MALVRHPISAGAGGGERIPKAAEHRSPTGMMGYSYVKTVSLPW